jgi:hypothetical protein
MFCSFDQTSATHKKTRCTGMALRVFRFANGTLPV